ncbi:hypothetical protein HGRIS_011972 [Hohenbuehelia grisea]|uniref:Uncharacterized protein n=1 Tax=Hohenbuehelia grisea TaxID=104357 RepID=A0ABR3JWP0_9AGAR
MKIIHQNGFNRDEFEIYRPIIHKSVLGSAHARLVSSQQTILIRCTLAIPQATFSVAHANYSQGFTDLIVDYHLNASTGSILSPETADTVHQLWREPNIPKVMDKHSSSF